MFPTEEIIEISTQGAYRDMARAGFPFYAGLTWEEAYPDAEQRASAEFDARFYRQMDERLRKEAQKGRYYCDLDNQNP